MNRSDHQLIQNAIDGSLAGGKFRTLQQRMRDEPELAALYHDYALLDHSLSEEFEGKRMIGRPLPQPVRRKFPTAAVIGIAAAVALGAFLVALVLPGPKPTPLPQTASLTLSDDAAWTIDGGRPADASPTISPTDRLDLQCGVARLVLPNGSTAIVTAPAKLVYHATEHIELIHGIGRFRNESAEDHFTVATGTLTAVDLGTEFGVVSRSGGGDELHVFEGQVRLQNNGSEDGPVLFAGEAATVGKSGAIDRMAARAEQFPSDLPRFRRILLDRFTTRSSSLNGRRPAFGPASWKLAQGSVSLADGKLEGSDFTTFLAMPPAPDSEHPVLLASMELAPPAGGQFHSPGWAGLSFFQGETEHLFFGDSFGPERTWSIDVKQGRPPVLPTTPVTGARSVTLRCDFQTGETSLHDGPIPLGPAFVKGLLPPGLSFDRVRLGSSPEATIAVRSIDVRLMER
jgi:hypothetical protein